jgi:hypothetical protein
MEADSMDKQSRKVLVLLKCLVALVLVTGISTTSVATVIYNVDRAVAPGIITGTIETNGAIGVLTSADIIDWNLTVDADGDPATLGQLLGPLSGNNSSFNVTGSALTATPTALFFDFSSPDFDIVQIITTAPGPGVVWQLQAAAPIFSDESIGDTFSQAFATHLTQQQIATAAVAGKVVEVDLEFAGGFVASGIVHLNLATMDPIDTTTSPLIHVQAKGSPGRAVIRGFGAGGEDMFDVPIFNCLGVSGVFARLTAAEDPLLFTFEDLSLLFANGDGVICLDISGPPPFSAVFEFDIMFTGGTGDFEGATGTALIRGEAVPVSNDGSFLAETGTIVGTIFLPDDDDD